MNLTKTTTVLNMVDQDSDRAAFDATSDNPEEETRKHYMEVDAEVWRDMGRPETITVTIEPGDTLNAVPQ